MRYRSVNSARRIPKRALVYLSIVTLVVLIGGGLHLRSVHIAQQTSGKIPSVKKSNEPQSSSTKSQSTATNSSTQKSDGLSSTTRAGTSNTTGQTGGNSATLLAPSGSFVSNHRPGQNGSPTQEQSVCITTPGAKCYIKFTKDNVVKTLDTKVADASGSVVWDWDIKGSGMASGSWQIEAVASLNDQTKTTLDPNGLLEIN